MFKRQDVTEPKNRRLLFIIPVVIVVAIVAVTAVALTRPKDNKTNASSAASKSELPETTAKSKFSFEPAKASGWRQGPANGTSMALFSNDQACFTSVEYKKGSVDTDTALQKIQTDLTNGGYTSSMVGTADAKLQLNSSTKDYKITQYSVTGNGGAGQLYGGQGYGYATLDDGYISVLANCNTAQQLPSALNALQAIKYDETI